ncbi:MAG: hypothetical protein OXI33_02355, partial [Chloroflexota bacterium]|nr:hypothetical protein [Chloroflexota bacterium]
MFPETSDPHTGGYRSIAASRQQSGSFNRQRLAARRRPIGKHGIPRDRPSCDPAPDPAGTPAAARWYQAAVGPASPGPEASRTVRYTTYTRFAGGLLDALNLEALLERLTDFLLDGGFAGGPHYHPYWGWSGTEDTSSLEALKQALLRALVESGELTPEIVRELRGEGEGDEELRKRIAALLDDLVERMVAEGYLSVGDGGGMLGAAGDPEGRGGEVDEA